RFLPRQMDAHPLSAATNGAGKMQQARDFSATGKYKFLERSQLGLALVHEMLEPCDVVVGYRRHLRKGLPRGRGQDPAGVEEFVLHPEQFCRKPSRLDRKSV